MASRSCLACGGTGPFAFVYERHGFRLVRCGCGLVFQDPQPDPAVLADAYYQDERFARALAAELREVTLASARRKLELLSGLGPPGPGTRLLDVGASSGAWLEVAAQTGARGTGVEIGAATAGAARERGLDVRTGTLEDAFGGLAEGGYDLITFWDVLEHLPDPRHELDLARRLLAPGGRVAITCPNVEGLYPTLTYELLARRTGVWEYPELPVHLFDFSPGTLRRVLERSGYAAERIATFATPYRHYRSTSLAPERTGAGVRGAGLRAAFRLIQLGAYPLARALDRGNSMLALARAPDRASP